MTIKIGLSTFDLIYDTYDISYFPLIFTPCLEIFQYKTSSWNAQRSPVTVLPRPIPPSILPLGRRYPRMAYDMIFHSLCKLVLIHTSHYLKINFLLLYVC